jgi:hypothetical protein
VLNKKKKREKERRRRRADVNDTEGNIKRVCVQICVYTHGEEVKDKYTY